MRAARRKPPKPADGPQLLTIPNRDAVVEEFRRSAPTSQLINIELEKYRLLSAGPILKLCAFIKDPKLTIEHVILYRGEIREKDLIDGARMLAQNAERVTWQHRQRQQRVA